MGKSNQCFYPCRAPNTLCKMCREPFDALRRDAGTCSSRRRKAKQRKREKRDRSAAVAFEALCEESANEGGESLS